jgi:hypothetical protein
VYYILAEAKAATGGLPLGPVGGRTVTETLIGLLRADATSYPSNKPGWTPFLGADQPPDQDEKGSENDLRAADSAAGEMAIWPIRQAGAAGAQCAWARRCAIRGFGGDPFPRFGKSHETVNGPWTICAMMPVLMLMCA